MESEKHKSIKAALPLIFGIIGLIGYCLYFLVRNLPSDNPAFLIVLFLPPAAFLAGIVTAIVFRKRRSEHSAAWLGGLFICVVGLIMYILLFALIIYVSTSV